MTPRAPLNIRISEDERANLNAAALAADCVLGDGGPSLSALIQTLGRAMKTKRDRVALARLMRR